MSVSSHRVMNRNPRRHLTLPHSLSPSHPTPSALDEKQTDHNRTTQTDTDHPTEQQFEDYLARLHHVPRNSLSLHSFLFVPLQLSAQEVFFDGLLQRSELVTRALGRLFGVNMSAKQSLSLHEKLNFFVTSRSEIADMALGASVRECSLHEKSCQWVKRNCSSTSGVFSS